MIALYTLIRRELVRMFRIASQVFLPPIITTTLYFLIFGTLMGKRIGMIDGVDYLTFIAPGLIMMSVITNAYANVSSSLFSMRFQKNIEEMLISPMHNGSILLGFILGGVLRGFIVALMVFLVSCFFVTWKFNHIPLTIFVTILVSTLFSLAGFTNAMVAKTFDDIMLIPTFVLTPLTYLGGIFYSVSMLPPFWNALTHFNPIYYTIGAFRYAMIGQEGINITLALSIICIITVILVILNMMLMKKGVGLRE
jgi:ABC-2 type transport system permease protein